MKILFSAAIALALLSGCSAISAIGDAATPLDVYDLQPAPASQVATRASSREVIVELPSTGGALETDRILIRPTPLQAQYLPDARWSAPTPEFVQTLVLRSLENRGALRYVGRRPVGPGGDFALVAELTDWQIELTEAAPIARVGLTLRLVRESDARILGSRSFAGAAPASSTETLDLVQALDAAAGPMLAEITDWVVAGVR